MINKKNYMQSSSTTGKVTEFFLTSVMLTLNDLRGAEGWILMKNRLGMESRLLENFER